MPKQAGLFDRADRTAKLLRTRDFLERVNKYVAWENFRPLLDAALSRKERSKGGRPAFDELCGILGDGVDQAADFTSCTTSIPSLNFTPSMTFGN